MSKSEYEMNNIFENDSSHNDAKNTVSRHLPPPPRTYAPLFICPP